MDEKLKLLQYYRYRTARPSGGFVIFPRKFMRSFEETLAKMAGVSIDNHTCYLVELPYNTIKSFWFTDDTMIMGDGIQKSS